MSRPGTVAESEEFAPPRVAWYVVAVLALANTSAFIDRQILGLLVGPIRRDLGITDTQMGVLYGLAFALFYTLLGIPIGRVADRASRRTIIAVGIAVWSVMTALCGMARTYDQLLLARFGIAIGEAALAAPALSLIADYFAPDRRATAFSVYTLGVYLGAGLANLVGGALLARFDGTAAVVWPIIGEIRPWQQVFVLVGLPGLAIALLVAAIAEPARHETGQHGDSRPFAIVEVTRYVAANRRTFLCHGFGYALFALVNFATAAWLPTHLIRTYGWTAARAGITLGALTATVGVAGVVAGGRASDLLMARGHADAKLRVGIIAAVANLVCGIAYTLAPS
ncbi:MAG TPA: MFS transporter, partial [Gemmatimonadaceae bacterium]|nr:MFS transporter [Gemmatimonadaceae bacterium]